MFIPFVELTLRLQIPEEKDCEKRDIPQLYMLHVLHKLILLYHCFGGSKKILIQKILIRQVENDMNGNLTPGEDVIQSATRSTSRADRLD
jgi:hypothetical protein